MPVHNAELFVRESLESILNQDFFNFEILLINDGSTDSSEEILLSFSDERIRFIKHEKAIGVARSMNEAFKLCRGKYIARMDADDISLPTRFSRQVSFLDENPHVDVVFGRIEQIDVYGNSAGKWADDMNVTTYEDVVKILPYRNCLANPTFMMRSKLAELYKQPEGFPIAEDYAFWMMLAAHGCVLEKIPEVVVKYRIHPSSLTVASNRKNPVKKYVHFQWHYFKEILKQGPWNVFHLRFCLGFLLNILRYPWRVWVKPALQVARKVWRAKPWKLIVQLYKLKRQLKALSKVETRTFFFFPFYHVGGAERVHADILNCLPETNPVVFFTKISENTGFLNRFEKSAICIDVGELCWYPFFKSKTYKIIAQCVNAQKSSKIFGSNSIAMYDIIPHLNENVIVMDLIHAFVHPEESGPEKWSLPIVNRIQRRVLISKKTIEELRIFYRKHHVNDELNERVVFIRNYTDIPENNDFTSKKENHLRVVYVGRGTAEKRISLMGAIANGVKRHLASASFVFIGKDLETSMDAEWRGDCIFTGEIVDDLLLAEEMKKADILLMTSSREGLPMVMMEAMVFGVVPVVTAVGDIPNVISNGTNGFLLPAFPEDQLVEEAVHTILELNSNRIKLEEAKNEAAKYAAAEFSHQTFHKSYRQLFGL
jgi:glycosyltransferase involved in cell wall biosynthesis